MNFYTRDLKLFIRIAELQSVTKGANNMAMSPAAASMRIKLLEDRLGGALFKREYRGMFLTPLGEILFGHAQKILEQADSLLNDMAMNTTSSINLVEGKPATLRIAANTTSMTELLPDILSKYLHAYPSVNIDLQELVSDDVVVAVENGTAEIGVISGPTETRDLHALCFAHDRLVIAMSHNHSLRERHISMSLQEALRYDQVGMDTNHTLQVFISSKAKQYKLDMPVRMYVKTYELMARMISVGVGIGILPESVVNRYKDSLSLHSIELSEPWSIRRRSLIMASVDDLLPPAAAFVSSVLSSNMH